MSATVNLIPTHRRQVRHRMHLLNKWLGLVGGYGLGLIVLSFGARMLWAGTADSLAEDQTKVQEQTRQTRAQRDHLQDQRQSLVKRIDANQAVTEQPDWSLLIRLLAQSLPDHVVLRRCALTPMPRINRSSDEGLRNIVARGSDSFASGTGQPSTDLSVAVAGFAKSHQALNRYVLKLERVGLFKQVRRLSTTRQPVPGTNTQAIAFELRCQLVRQNDKSGERKGGDIPTGSRDGRARG